MSAKVSVKAEEAICALYKNGSAGPSISREVGCSRNTIYNVLRRNGATPRPAQQSRKLLPLNERFFEVIDCESKAYILGFIAADGCVSNGMLSIGLHPKDASHLEKIRLAIGYGSPVKVTGIVKPMARLNIKRKPLVNDLIRLGITERKSLTAAPWQPEGGAQSLLNHYWRGVFDGDGCLTRNGKIWSVSIVGSRRMMESFSDFVFYNIGYRGAVKAIKSIFQVRYGGLTLPQEVCKVLYKDSSIFLDRKKSLFDALMEIKPQRRPRWLLSVDSEAIKTRLSTWPQ